MHEFIFHSHQTNDPNFLHDFKTHYKMDIVNIKPASS